MRFLLKCLDFAIIRTTKGDFNPAIFVLRDEIDDLMRYQNTGLAVLGKMIRVIGLLFCNPKL